MTSDSSCPAPIRFYLPIGSLEEPIALYDGEIHFRQGENSFIANGQINFIWLPSPRIQFKTKNLLPEQVNSLVLREDLSLQLEDGKDIDYGIITEKRIVNRSATLSGVIGEKVAWSADTPISSVLFVLLNFQKLVGTPISFSNKDSSCRLVLRQSDWMITLDAIENQDEIFKLLELRSSFGVTHVGKLEREDGKTFTKEDALAMLEALNWYSSFAIGRWTGYCLPAGFNDAGEKVWQVWESSQIAPFVRQSSWLGWGSRCSIFREPFAGFLKHWHDENWQEIVKLVVHWYIESNSQRGSIEGSIILAQTALELLGSAILVENNSWFSSEKGFERLPASDKIGALLLWGKIPPEIPRNLDSLTKESKQKNWKNGAQAITEIRNKITHPQKNNREKFISLDRNVKIDAWKLSVWYLEILILRLFRYEGRYVNRISGETEPLP